MDWEDENQTPLSIIFNIGLIFLLYQYFTYSAGKIKFKGLKMTSPQMEMNGKKSV